MKPQLRQTAVIKPSFLRDKGVDAVQALIDSVRDRALTSARSLGLANPTLTEEVHRWFKNRIFAPIDPNEPRTWQGILAEGHECEYVAVVVEGEPAPAAEPEVDPGTSDPNESDYDAQNRYRKEHGCLAPEQR